MPESSRIEELKRRVELDPASGSFAALAEEYRRSGRFQDAIYVCQQGLQRHPAYLSARVTLGRALVEIGEYDTAEAELQQVIRVAPENLAAIRALAEIHRRRPETITVEEQMAEAESASARIPAPPPAAPMPLPVSAAVMPQQASAAPAPLQVSTAGDVPLTVTSHVQAIEPLALPSPLPVSTTGDSPLTVTTHAQAHTHAVVNDPALAGLEAFLAAIQRARRELGAASTAS
jgi:tetratricopeptide (TPR) repeat protein